MIVARAWPARALVTTQNQGRDNADEYHHKKKKGEASDHLGRIRSQAAEFEEYGEATDYDKPCGGVQHRLAPSRFQYYVGALTACDISGTEIHTGLSTGNHDLRVG